MKFEIPTSTLWRPAMLLGAAAVVVGLLWFGYLSVRSPASVTSGSVSAAMSDFRPGASPSVPVPAEPDTMPTTGIAAFTPSAPELALSPELSTLEPDSLIATDLGSGSAEFSGVTVNEDLGRLLVVDDEDLLFEFDLGPDGTPTTPPRRTIYIRAGAGDIEGIAWISDTTYVLAHEADGRLTVVTVDEDTTEITNADVLRTVDTGVLEDDGKGLEGVAYLDEDVRGASSVEFVVIDERPATLHLIDVAGTVVSSLALDMVDASGVWATSPDRVTVVSDEGRMVVDLQIDPSGVVRVIGQLSLLLPDGRFEQPEGIARTRNPDRLYIVGEAPGPGHYAFGSWQRTVRASLSCGKPVAPPDCSGDP